MGKIKKYFVGDVGDGNCTVGVDHRTGLVVDCGDQNGGRKSADKLLSALSEHTLIDRNNSVSFVLTGHNPYRYNGFLHMMNRTEKGTYFLNRREESNNRGLYMSELYYPGPPVFDDDREFFHACLAVSLRREAARRENEEVTDVSMAARGVFEGRIEFYPLYRGDVLTVGDSVFQTHWPPEDLRDSGTADSLTNALEYFREARETDPQLADLYDYVADLNLFERYRQGTLSTLDRTSFSAKNSELPPETQKASRQLTTAINRIGLAFSEGDEVLFLANLEKRELNKVVTHLSNNQSLRYKLLLAPGHGTVFSSELYKLNIEISIASLGEKHAGNFQEEYKQISDRLFATWVNGDVCVNVSGSPKVEDLL